MMSVNSREILYLKYNEICANNHIFNDGVELINKWSDEQGDEMRFFESPTRGWLVYLGLFRKHFLWKGDDDVNIVPTLFEVLVDGDQTRCFKE